MLKAECTYCGKPIGFFAGRWIHNAEDGPDAYTYCGDDYGTDAAPPDGAQACEECGELRVCSTEYGDVRDPETGYLDSLTLCSECWEKAA